MTHKIMIAMNFFVITNAFVTNFPSTAISIMKKPKTSRLQGGSQTICAQPFTRGLKALDVCSVSSMRAPLTPLHLHSSGLDDGNKAASGDNYFNTELSRRDAIFTTVAAVFTTTSILASNPSNANAIEDATKPRISSLEDISLGEGQWTHISGTNAAHIGTYTMAKSVVPPSFATYAARFLINFDVGVEEWWKEIKEMNSLLPSNEERSRLGSKFGDLSRSVQISLEDFILYPSKNDGDGNNPVSGGGLKSSINPKDYAAIQQRYEDLLQVFFNAYDGNENEDLKRHLGLLFSTLPAKYQPVNGLRKMMVKSTNLIPSSTAQMKPSNPMVQSESMIPESRLSVAFTEELEYLLPPKYAPEFDTLSNSFRIEPPVALYEIGVDNEFGQNAVATLFGPLSSNLLKREKPDLSLGLYTLLGLNGALACAMTHGAVIPFDVVKTRMQTNPDRYSNLIEGTMSIAKTEGIQGFTLGAQATVSGYLYYGLSVYPSYSFSKWFLSHAVLSPAYATAHADAIALVAGAIAAVIASLGLTPLEACRIRTVAEPEVYRDIGLMGTLKVISTEDAGLGWKALYAGLPALMTRQVIFGSVKFLAFERACEALFLTWPFLKDSSATALGVTLVAGAMSGALSSVVSQPADSVLTYVAKNTVKDDEDRTSLVSSILTMVEEEGAGSLFRGLGERCIWAAAIISGQFVLYDIFRTAIGINADDLSQVFEFVVKSTN